MPAQQKALFVMRHYKKTLNIRFAKSVDSDRLIDFRISQFKTAKEFELLDASLLEQQRGHIFIVEDGEDILSTMQVEKSNDKQNLMSISNIYVPDFFDQYSSFYLSKGATHKDYRNTGLNSYLRMLTLQLTHDDNEINSMTGFAYENAPRLNLLQKLGYEFYPVSFIDKSYSKPFGQLYFLNLEKSNFGKALNQLEEETKDLQNQFVINSKIFS